METEWKFRDCWKEGDKITPETIEEKGCPVCGSKDVRFNVTSVYRVMCCNVFCNWCIF